MALILFNNKHLLLVLTLLFASAFIRKSVSLEEEGEDEEPNYQLKDPAQVVAKALLCFNDKYIYGSCEESYRLAQTGNINVPYEATDQYCNGPCLEETNLVLDCIDHTLSTFLFYNKASVGDIRATLKAACSYGDERGHFNVAEHLESDHGVRLTSHIDELILLLIFLGSAISLLWCGL